MFQLVWQEFSRRPNISKLPINEQIRQFQLEQFRYQQYMQYVSQTMVNSGVGTGGNKSQTTDASSTTFDTDSQAFINAAAITDSTQQTAINNLVVGLKADGTWTKMKAIYPFVGGTATTHKYNLKDPRDLNAAFRLTFNGGWTHSANGALGNGVNNSAQTSINALNNLSEASYNYSVYSRNQFLSSQANMVYSSETEADENGTPLYLGNMSFVLRDLGMDIEYSSESYQNKFYNSTNTIGFFNVNNDAGTISLYKNGAAQILTGPTYAVDLPNTTIELAAPAPMQ
jgi:hypothetical protein